MGSGDRQDDVQLKPSEKKSISKLTKLAHERLQRGDLQGAMEHFKSAADQARTTSDTRVKMSCFLNAGACLVSLGQYRRGLEFLDSASEIVKSVQVGESNETDAVDDHVLGMSADVHYNSAVAAQGVQDYNRAIESFKQCIDLYMKACSKVHAADAYNNLAGCYREAGQFGEEIASLKSSQQLYNELGDCSREAMVCVDLAKVYLRVGNRESCKMMAGNAKMLCLRVDDQRTQGKLYSQFGLLYTSLGSFDEAIQNFERALPLVREKGIKSDSSLQTEASLLQNIGAAYNEKELYTEAIIYHREAAALHGKTKRYNSEAKCLCNLAFAQSQIKDYPEAAKSFTNALIKAQLAGNNYLQFQACEGLGAVNYQMGRFGESVSYFKQALALLDGGVTQDTGTERERVAEKLLDASERLERMKEISVLERKSLSPKSPSPTQTPTYSSSDEEYNTFVRKDTPTHHSLKRSLSPELDSSTVVRAKTLESQVDLEGLPLPGKRGIGSLPPLGSAHPTKSVERNTHEKNRKTTSPVSDESTSNKQPSRKQTKTSKKRTKRDNLPQISEDPPDDNYDSQLKAYVKSYKGSSDSSDSTSSSSESEGDRNSGDNLGASVFSRHAPKQEQHQRVPSSPPVAGTEDLSTSELQAGSQEYIQEGSLALGPNAREHFTTQTHTLKKSSDQKHHKKQKHKQKKTEIVPKAPPPTQAATGSSQSLASDHHQNPGSSRPPPNNTSKVCVIL